MLASDNGHVEVVDKLLQHGASVDLQEKVFIKVFKQTAVIAIFNTDSW